MRGLLYPADIPPEYRLSGMLSETLWQWAAVSTVGILMGLVVAFLLLPLLRAHNGTHRRITESHAPASSERRRLPPGVEPLSNGRWRSED